MRAFVAALVSACSVGLAACDSAEDPPRDVPIESIETEVIDVVCDALSACDCDAMTSFYQSSAQCRETTNALADQIRLSRGELGLTWDSTCLGKVLDRIDDAGCEGTFGESEEDECAPPCYYLHGDLQAGDPCSFADQFVSDCAQGLVCAQGLCAAPCDTANDAFAGNGEACIERPCEEGLLCNYEVGLCELLPKIGERCDLGQCEKGGFCETEDPDDPMTPLVCKAPYAIGEPCRGHLQCESEYCPNGFCGTLPEKGEDCRGTFVCADGLDCDPESQKCVEGNPAVCEIPVPLPGL